MATKARTAPVTRGRRSRDATWSGRVALLFSMIVAGLMFPVTVIMGVGLLPTAVAFYIDRTTSKSTALTVGAMNLTGVVPFVLQLFQDGFRMQNSMLILAKANTWIYMYGAASLGWILVYVIPPTVAHAMIMQHSSRIAELRRRQGLLQEKWGDEVAGLPSVPSDPRALRVQLASGAAPPAETAAPA